MVYTKAEALRRYAPLKAKLEKQMKMDALMQNVKEKLNQNSAKKVRLSAEKPVALPVGLEPSQSPVQVRPLSFSLSDMLTPGSPDGARLPGSGSPRYQPGKEALKPREKKRKRLCAAQTSQEDTSDYSVSSDSRNHADGYYGYEDASSSLNAGEACATRYNHRNNSYYSSSDAGDDSYCSGYDGEESHSDYDNDTSSTTESTDFATSDPEIRDGA